MPISSNELKHFKRKFFVETGSAGLGWGIDSALKAGFEQVYSVDINPNAYNECQAIFKDNQRVHISLDDCGKWLEPTLNKICEPCTIYLDANGWKNETESPFHSSIDAIVRHGGKEHIILVDDQNHGHVSTEQLIEELRKPNEMVGQLKRINPDYTFYLIDTHTEDMKNLFVSWVLVADPEKNRIIENVNQSFI